MKKDTPKTDKGRTTLKNLMEEAMVEADRAQKDAEDKAAKANKTKEEADLKLAEKAEKAAASARRKSIGLQRKWEDALKLMKGSMRKGRPMISRQERMTMRTGTKLRVGGVKGDTQRRKTRRRRPRRRRTLRSISLMNEQ